ncbi:rhomboid family intramembrane serine protease [Natrarchaeobius halalkaliphilus]|uniref:Rhomboid family intramembrane serine protease n=1 Tax=Natrarchaeobius halalkaliphilus TaxID=1679091 RepID=A0A3N6P1L6_9EURY|nr:rhomboid family intramembrane serine protease [Natrarchaeobius halalkaliphilus]RQG88985.1 rhomboid family intramembrane serine protease [Natrarchaeobius halalkaliphilus]
MANRSRTQPTQSVGSEPRASGDSGSTGPIIELLVVFAVVFALQSITAVVGVMTGLFVLSPPLSDSPWTIVTSVYAHGSLWHLLSNSLALVVFGWPVARATTRLRFHTFFLMTGALAGVAQVGLTGFAATLSLVPATPTAGVLGASGAVFALLGYLVASNRLSDGLASFVDIPRWLTILVFAVLAGILTLATAAPGVALIAHFTGFLVGAVAGRARVLHVRSPAR